MLKNTFNHKDVMRIEDLLFKKEELPIISDTCFVIPIHPKLLDPAVKINERVANQVFPEVAIDWYSELTAYAQSPPDSKTKEWIREVFTHRKPKIKRQFGRQVISPLYWEDKVQIAQNGFVTSMSISRNAGGSLYLADDWSSEQPISLEGSNGYVLFALEKIKEFAFRIKEEHKYAVIKSYSQHNVDNYPGALFLRNWAIAYMNGVFTRHYQELFDEQGKSDVAKK